MAGKIGGSSFSVLTLDGHNLLASKVKEFSYKTVVPLERSDGLGDTWDEHTPIGIRTAEIKQGGAFFDTVANRIHDALKAAPLTNRILCFASAGNVIGGIFGGCEGVSNVGYEVLNPGKALTKANAEYQVTGQIDDDGVILQHYVEKSVDWNTKTDGDEVDYTEDPAQRVVPITSSSVANPSIITTPYEHGLTTGDYIVVSGHAGSTPALGAHLVTVISATTFSIPVNVTVGGTGGTFILAQTQFGGVGYLSVTHLGGYTNFVGKIRDSPDNVTFADLIVFADNVLAPFAERLEVAGTVDQYLSFDGNVTGIGTMTAFAGFKRNRS